MFEQLSAWAKSLMPTKKSGRQTTAAADDDATPVATINTNKLAPDYWEYIERAMEQGLPVDCQVLVCKKGGYTVSINGHLAFMPKSLSHYMKGHTPDKMLGRQIKVHVITVEDKQVIVSRLDTLNKAYENLAVGSMHDAEVVKIQESRLIVYMPDNDLYARVPQVDLSWSLEAMPHDYHIGQKVKVRIIGKDGIDRIHTSIRQAEGTNPYENCVNDYHEGDVMTVEVINVLEYAAFVKIAEGVVAFLHRSEVHHGKPIADMKSLFRNGDTIKVEICRVDHDQRRIFVSMKSLNKDQAKDTLKAGSVHPAIITNVTDTFATLELPYGVTTPIRLIRFAKAGIVPVEDETIEVKVLSYSPESREVRIALRFEQD